MDISQLINTETCCFVDIPGRSSPVLSLTPIRLINSHAVLQQKIIRAPLRALKRVPVEECASEVPLAGWSVCLAEELIYCLLMN